MPKSSEKASKYYPVEEDAKPKTVSWTQLLVRCDWELEVPIEGEETERREWEEQRTARRIQECRTSSTIRFSKRIELGGGRGNMLH